LCLNILSLTARIVNRKIEFVRVFFYLRIKIKTDVLKNYSQLSDFVVYYI